MFFVFWSFHTFWKNRKNSAFWCTQQILPAQQMRALTKNSRLSTEEKEVKQFSVKLQRLGQTNRSTQILVDNMESWRCPALDHCRWLTSFGNWTMLRSKSADPDEVWLLAHLEPDLISYLILWENVINPTKRHASTSEISPTVPPIHWWWHENLHDSFSFDFAKNWYFFLGHQGFCL